MAKGIELLTQLKGELDRIEYALIKAHTLTVEMGIEKEIPSSGMIMLLMNKAKRCESSSLLLRRGMSSLYEKQMARNALK